MELIFATFLKRKSPKKLWRNSVSHYGCRVWITTYGRYYNKIAVLLRSNKFDLAHYYFIAPSTMAFQTPKATILSRYLHIHIICIGSQNHHQPNRNFDFLSEAVRCGASQETTKKTEVGEEILCQTKKLLRSILAYVRSNLLKCGAKFTAQNVFFTCCRPS